MSDVHIIGYKFQAPNGAYWYIRADDQPTINYWKARCKLTPLSDKQARVAAEEARCSGSSLV